MRGRAGAGNTHARSPTCISTPPPALQPRFDLYGLRVLSNSDRAPACKFIVCTCQDQAGSRLPVCLHLDLPRPDGCKVRVWVWLGASSFLQLQPWLDASNPERVFLLRLGRGLPSEPCLATNYLECRGLEGPRTKERIPLGGSGARWSSFRVLGVFLPQPLAWDWELFHQPEGFWLRSYFASGFGVRPSRRPRSLSFGC